MTGAVSAAFTEAYPANTEPPPVLRTVSMDQVRPVDAVQIAGHNSLPVWLGMLHAIVGEGESGKTWLGVHTVMLVAEAGHNALVIDGEMSANSWRKRFAALNAEPATLARIHYVEMGDGASDVALVRATIKSLDVKICIWDSALSLISRTVQSENDNAGVSAVYDRLREIVRDGPAGLIVDHTAKGSGALVSRGASAKFNALDVSYGVKLAEGAMPGQHARWSSIISVEKDRHGLLPERRDRTAIFEPLGGGQLVLDISESAQSTNRLSAGFHHSIVTQIARLDPPAASATDAYKRLGGRKTDVLGAFKQWAGSQ